MAILSHAIGKMRTKRLTGFRFRAFMGRFSNDVMAVKGLLQDSSGGDIVATGVVSLAPISWVHAPLPPPSQPHPFLYLSGDNSALTLSLPQPKHFRAESCTYVPANSIFSGPVTSTLSAIRFHVNPFICQCKRKKEKKRGKKEVLMVSHFTLLLVVFE